MAETKFDVFGMCNALYDIQAEVSEAKFAELKLDKGAMMLLSDDEQKAIVPSVYTDISNTEAGGSGANTMIGIALLGGTACYTSRVGRDEHGRMYREGLTAQKVKANLGVGEGATGVSLIMVTPDAQRTMCTYLGMAQDLREEDVDGDDLRASKYLYITGYLWDTENQKKAVLHAMKEAKAAGVKVALSLSDPFCVARHKDDFLSLLKEYVDVVFANKDESINLTDAVDAREAALQLAYLTGGIAVVTMDATGSLIVQGDALHEIPVYPVKAVDTTGAGDMYAAGILYGLTQNLPLPVTGRLASYCAAQVVAQLGPRLDAFDADALQIIKSGF